MAALEVTLSFPIGVWVVAGLPSLPAWTYRATCPSVTASATRKCDCPIYSTTIRWPKLSSRPPLGSLYSTSAATPTPSSSSARYSGKHFHSFFSPCCPVQLKIKSYLIQLQPSMFGPTDLSVSWTLRTCPPGLRRSYENVRLSVAGHVALRQIPAG